MLRFTMVLLAICVCILAGCTDKSAGNPSPAPAAVASQDDALHQAKTVDLPALKAADRVVVSESPPPAGTGKSAEITDAARIARLVGALKPTKAPPSAGEQQMTIRFYKGPPLLREVWVYPDGEWGFRRPGTSWTTGRSDELIRLIRQELADAPAAR